MIEFIRYFPQPLHARSGIVPPWRHKLFFENRIQLFIYASFILSMLHIFNYNIRPLCRVNVLNRNFCFNV